MKQLIATLLLITGLQIGFAQTPTREITNITGDLYRFQNNAHYSVFLVTDEGVIATDPINEEAATWLKSEITKRFNQQVKYVIYSHHHADHISGGKVFDAAVFVGHSLTKQNIIEEKMSVPIPDETFDDKKTIELGGKKVELMYPGKSHSDNCIAVYFPDEKTVFVVDFISAKRLPYRTLNNSYFPDWMESIKKVEELDFDILAPGHGELGTKADAADHRKYIEELYTAVKDGVSKGQTLEEMKNSILLEEYKDFGRYADWREMNIEGVYNFLNTE